MNKFETSDTVSSIIDYISNKTKTVCKNNKDEASISEKSSYEYNYSESENFNKDTVTEPECDNTVQRLKTNKIQSENVYLNFNEKNIMQAFVNSEIFGKPKARTRRRR